MMIHEITALAGKYKSRKRVGRGPGSGVGKRSGRGQKGAGSRSGNSRRFQFEGGQMPYFRRMPKFGFSNANFRVHFWLVNLRQIVNHPDFASGGVVNQETLIKSGLVRDDSRDIKILGDLPEGEDKIAVKLDVTVNRVTDPARTLIEAAGGSVTETGTRRDRVRGVDRNSDDRSPTNQTKKAKRRAFQQKKADAAARGEALKKK
jgi:large subunit ribosomal protein L15